MEKLCCICKKSVDSETAAILTVGGYGNAKYLCDDCAKDLDISISAVKYDVIKSAMNSIGAKMAENNIDDELVIATVGELFIGAKKRARAIKAGEYDFSLDVENDVEPIADGGEKYDIPEELQETEEDKSLDAKDEKKAAFFDKIFNWISLGILVAALGAVVYLVFFK